jgi:hypothetical protein
VSPDAAFCGIISPLLDTALRHHPKHIFPLRQLSRDAKRLSMGLQWENSGYKALS